MFFGYQKPDSGAIKKDGQKVDVGTTGKAIRLKIAMCPEDRRAEGIFPHISVKDNMMLAALPQLSKMGFVSNRLKDKLVDDYIKKFSIKTPSPRQLIRNLSGGNQQKVILARWLITNPQLIIFDEPTRGIDVGAKEAIEELIRSIAEQGISVLYISSEIEELVNNCDRLLIMREGSIVGELTGDDIDRNRVLDYIAGNT